MNQNQYIDQHRNIKEEIRILRELLDENFLENASKIALHINTLAGKIKIHLMSEDKYLYPELQEHSDIKVRHLATSYQREMGMLAQYFAEFKELYNTQSKIRRNQENCPKDLKAILNMIEKRIEKEEGGLYQIEAIKLHFN